MRRQNSRSKLQKRALPAAVSAEQAKELPFSKLHAQILQHWFPLLIGKAHISKEKHRFPIGRFRPRRLLFPAPRQKRTDAFPQRRRRQGERFSASSAKEHSGSCGTNGRNAASCSRQIRRKTFSGAPLYRISPFCRSIRLLQSAAASSSRCSASTTVIPSSSCTRRSISKKRAPQSGRAAR